MGGRLCKGAKATRLSCRCAETSQNCAYVFFPKRRVGGKVEEGWGKHILTAHKPLLCARSEGTSSARSQEPDRERKGWCGASEKQNHVDMGYGCDDTRSHSRHPCVRVRIGTYFKKAPAAADKQGVSAEQQRRGLPVRPNKVLNVAARVAGGVQDVDLKKRGGEGRHTLEKH